MLISIIKKNQIKELNKIKKYNIIDEKNSFYFTDFSKKEINLQNDEIFSSYVIIFHNCKMFDLKIVTYFIHNKNVNIDYKIINTMIENIYMFITIKVEEGIIIMIVSKNTLESKELKLVIQNFEKYTISVIIGFKNNILFLSKFDLNKIKNMSNYTILWKNFFWVKPLVTYFIENSNNYNFKLPNNWNYIGSEESNKKEIEYLKNLNEKEKLLNEEVELKLQLWIKEQFKENEEINEDTIDDKIISYLLEI